MQAPAPLVLGSTGEEENIQINHAVVFVVSAASVRLLFEPPYHFEFLPVEFLWGIAVNLLENLDAAE